MSQSGSASTSDPAHLGAYGLRVSGVEAVNHSLLPAPVTWPLLTIRRTTGTPGTFPFSIDESHLQYRTYDQTGEIGGVRLTREPLDVEFTSPGGFSDAALIHPDLGFVAAVANRWLGREVLHAGAFLTPAGAWGVLGAKEAGKSSLVAQLAMAGVGIVADDSIVLDDDSGVLAGPRCIDLRESAARYLKQGEDIGLVGERRRWRMHIPAVPASAPLQGWIVPEWGDGIEIQPIPPMRRPQLLLASRYLPQLPYPPERILPYLNVPFLRFGRPHRWEDAEKAAGVLLDWVW